MGYVGTPIKMTVKINAAVLKNQIKQVTENIDQDIKQTVRNSALDTKDEMIRTAPVDTGHWRDDVEMYDSDLEGVYEIGTKNVLYPFFWEVGFVHSGVITQPDGSRKFFPSLKGRFFRRPWLEPAARFFASDFMQKMKSKYKMRRA